MDLVIGGTFTVPNYAMVSAFPAKSMKWKAAIGKTGRLWLYHPDRSSVWVQGGPDSRGCGGNTIDFELDDGLGMISLVGPWHSNSDAFFKDTCIDVRDKHITWGCVGTGMEYDSNSGENRITGILWFDEEPTQGLFERVGLHAWEMQQANPETSLYSYRESEGGSSFGIVFKPFSLRLRDGETKEFNF